MICHQVQLVEFKQPHTEISETITIAKYLNKGSLLGVFCFVRPESGYVGDAKEITINGKCQKAVFQK